MKISKVLQLFLKEQHYLCAASPLVVGNNKNPESQRTPMLFSKKLFQNCTPRRTIYYYY